MYNLGVIMKISMFIAVNLLIGTLFTGCSVMGYSIQKEEVNDVDLFTEDTRKIKEHKPFNVKKQQIKFKKSQYLREEESKKKIDLGTI